MVQVGAAHPLHHFFRQPFFTLLLQAGIIRWQWVSNQIREWLSPGGLPGLQNRWRVALRAAVGSTPIHSRLFIGMPGMR